MFDKHTTARIICDTVEVTGASGKRWAIHAQLLSLYLDLVESIRREIAAFGYSAIPVALQGQHEVCRLEGEAIILVVERVVEGTFVGYDTTVFCRERDMRPVIAEAIRPLVTKYAEGDCAALQKAIQSDADDAEPE